MNKFLKKLLKIVAILSGIILLLYIAVYAYVSFNKRSIIRQVTEELGKKMNGKVAIGDVELSFFRQFPKISVLLNNISITDSMFKQHNHALFSAEKVFARISITKLIKKEAPLNGLVIEKGECYLFTDTTGYTNMYLLKQNKDTARDAGSASSEKSELQFVLLENINFTLDDRQKQKLHHYFVNNLLVKLGEADTALFFDATGNIIIHDMAFNVPRGGFLKEQQFTGDFKFRFDKQVKQLQFDSINIKLSGQPFNLTGRFDLAGDAPQFNLRAHTRQLSYDVGKAMLPKRLDSSLSLVALNKPIDVDVQVGGPLNGGEPLLFVNWTAAATQLKTPFLDFDSASFTGYFTNEVIKGLPRDDSNSVIRVHQFSANWHGMPLQSGSIEILNLFQPVLSCDLVSAFPLTKLNDVIGSSFLQMQSGEGSVNLTYKGPIVKNSNTNSFLNGRIAFKDGTILYQPRDVALKNLGGELTFKNSDVFVKDLRFAVLNNNILMQGQAKNLLNLINTDPGKASIDWDISTPALNLGAFNFLLKPGKKVANAPRSKDNLASATSNIDAVLDKAVLHVKLRTPSLAYHKFQAGGVNADVTLLANKYVLNDVSMSHAGGSIRMKGALVTEKVNSLMASLNASMTNVDVGVVFNAFENFGQNAIMGKNLDGKLTAQIDASIGLDENGVVIPSSAVSTIDFSLKNGGLNEFEPIMKLQNFLFRNRDFENIRFAELKDRLEIRNGDIKINRMEIQSSVLSFFVEGLYSMRGNTDISIQVPLNNLKKRGPDYKPENIGTDTKTKKSIFIRGRPGSDGNVSFKLDLFNRYKKENKNN